MMTFGRDLHGPTQVCTQLAAQAIVPPLSDGAARSPMTRVVCVVIAAVKNRFRRKARPPNRGGFEVRCRCRIRFAEQLSPSQHVQMHNGTLAS